jgi:uncharacterized protein
MTPLLALGPADAAQHLLLAHGAGAAMDSPFMATICELLAAEGIATLRFEFPYMANRRTGGKKQPPPSAELLLPAYLTAVETARAATNSPLFIGGKSMGGRVANMVAAQLWDAGQIKGVINLGYPLHAANTPDKLRTAALLALPCPTLIVQGTRDPFGTQAEFTALTLPPTIQFHWVADGDHDFGPRGASGFTRKGNLTAAAAAVARFMAAQAPAG